jgi:hypothetical protein
MFTMLLAGLTAGQRKGKGQAKRSRQRKAKQATMRRDAGEARTVEAAGIEADAFADERDARRVLAAPAQVQQARRALGSRRPPNRVDQRVAPPGRAQQRIAHNAAERAAVRARQRLRSSLQLGRA